MKIKITKAVTTGGRILTKDSVHDVDAKTADLLLKGKFATEHIEPQGQQPPAPTYREQLLAQYGKATKKELAQVKASAEEALNGNPEYPGAKLVIEVVEELLKKAK